MPGRCTFTKMNNRFINDKENNPPRDSIFEILMTNLSYTLLFPYSVSLFNLIQLVNKLNYVYLLEEKNENLLFYSDCYYLFVCIIKDIFFIVLGSNMDLLSEKIVEQSEYFIKYLSDYLKEILVYRRF